MKLDSSTEVFILIDKRYCWKSRTSNYYLIVETDTKKLLEEKISKLLAIIIRKQINVLEGNGIWLYKTTIKECKNILSKSNTIYNKLVAN